MSHRLLIGNERFFKFVSTIVTIKTDFLYLFYIREWQDVSRRGSARRNMGHSSLSSGTFLAH